MPMAKRMGRTVLGVRMGCHAFNRCCLKAVSIRYPLAYLSFIHQVVRQHLLGGRRDLGCLDLSGSSFNESAGDCSIVCVAISAVASTAPSLRSSETETAYMSRILREARVQSQRIRPQRLNLEPTKRFNVGEQC